ncbi:hypothetical protein [Catenulispora subtropica]|uniref:DoxX family protein n=1 Tax=Catenulispora subtropica TaxID=450798 RepID=A0ABP5EUI7_9ACTN
MQIIATVLALLLVAEWVMAPINLWTGRTLPLFERFTGHSPAVARTVFAPVKALAAALVLIGLFAEPVSVAGAVLSIVICGYYLIRLAAPGRRDPSGIAAFALFGACAAGLLITQLAR